ncbi:BH2985 [Halalkalibacterium halodurans C-125]|uniref:BH2985 protein n=1 Tax=Halalkalibacterium halodurans (strain ATCC BAA-125 / DSM 18197 / FERM 7344 / JCM 9153 / C-125) TaxID=272558 RepID=Q9K8M1_HALH5|nr:BH2985 [Halalkalibacterium halodurans C-125]
MNSAAIKKQTEKYGASRRGLRREP